MEYLLLLASFVGFILSYRSFLSYHKYKYSGKIPEIIGARQNTNLYLVLGLLSVSIFLILHFSAVELPL